MSTAGSGGVDDAGTEPTEDASVDHTDGMVVEDGSVKSVDCTVEFPSIIAVAQHNDHCYAIIDGTYDTWFAAAEACAKKMINDGQTGSSHLATISDEFEFVFVKDIALLLVDYWIGGGRTNGTNFMWVTGEPWLIFPCSGDGCDHDQAKYWANNEPGNSGSCVCYNGGSDRLHAEGCSDLKTVAICEWEP